MAEDLTEYMQEAGVRAEYLHADIDTLERIQLVRRLRLGEFDVLIGINLLREGLDIPECALVAILDADKEGLFRSRTSLIQTIGRAARHVEGRVILYADSMTDSLRYAIAETERRREKQQRYNLQNGITPQSINSRIQSHTLFEREPLAGKASARRFGSAEDWLGAVSLGAYSQLLGKRMAQAAADLEFEHAARLRDEIRKIETCDLELPLIAVEAIDSQLALEVLGSEKPSLSKRKRGGCSYRRRSQRGRKLS